MERLLYLEVRLLVLRFGRAQVVEALAHARGESVEELERQIAAIQERKGRRKQSSVSADQFIIESFAQRPGLLSAAQALVRRYENRTLLPELRDVKRFLERVGINHRSLKSRKVAVLSFIRALTKMSDGDIAELSSLSEGREGSDFELLARELMGGPEQRVRRSAAERSGVRRELRPK